VKLRDPVPRKLFTQAQDQQLFGGKTTGIKSSDQVAQRTTTLNMSIPIEPAKAGYSRKRNRNIPHEIGSLGHGMSDRRSLPYNRIYARKAFNEDLFTGNTIIIAIADQLPLSMGIFPSTYHSSVIEAWRIIESVNGFKSILTITGEPDSIGHHNRLVKFGAYLILEKTIEYQVMQWNGRAKNIRTMTG
jgi:hypothetical protein